MVQESTCVSEIQTVAIVHGDDEAGSEDAGVHDAQNKARIDTTRADLLMSIR